MKKSITLILCLLMVFSVITQAQRPEALYVRKATGQLKGVINKQPLTTVQRTAGPVKRLLTTCPECQQVSFGTFTPDSTYISKYGSDSVWKKTFSYQVQSLTLPGGYLNFNTGCISFTHYADTSYPDMPYWDGFTVSKTSKIPFPCDTACSNSCDGMQSQFSSITGGGVGGSTDPYVVGYYGFNEFYYPVNHTTLTFGSATAVCGTYITNNAYVFKSIRCGDQYAQKFGVGDSLLVRIVGYLSNSATDSVDYFLADYRNPAGAYIVDAWKWVNLTALGTVDSIAFRVITSDNGINGPNTPMYFCLDGIKTGNDPSCGTCAATDTTHNWFPQSNGNRKVATTGKALSLTVAPNPANSQVTVSARTGNRLEVFDAIGNRKYNTTMMADKQVINIATYRTGVYSIRVSEGTRSKAIQFVKQ